MEDLVFEPLGDHHDWDRESNMVPIRKALPDDATSMVEVRRAAILTKARDFHGSAGAEAWADDGASDRLARYTQQIADPNLLIFVAEGEDGIIGFVIVNPSQKELSAIYVKPNPIGLVGRALLSEAEPRVFETADFLTAVADLNAVRFYEANGYTDEGLTSWVDTTGVEHPCKLMRKYRPRVIV